MISVETKSDNIVLKGRRAGVEFIDGTPKRVPLNTGNANSPEKVAVSIEMPADGNYESALNAIFFNSFEEIAANQPPYWMAYARAHLLSGRATSPQSGEGQCAKAQSLATFPSGKGTIYPRLLHQVDPEFNSTARAMHYSGAVLVGMTVDTNGRPTELCIKKAAGWAWTNKHSLQ